MSRKAASLRLYDAWARPSLWHNGSLCDASALSLITHHWCDFETSFFNSQCVRREGARLPDISTMLSSFTRITGLQGFVLPLRLIGLLGCLD
jgi:hypothetical protein